MPKCTHRDRPSDEALCTVMADPGKSLCPRHQFMAELKDQQRNAKEAGKHEALAAGLGAKLPQTRGLLLQRGYHFTGTNSCRGCGQMVEWYHTPSGKNAPFDRMPHDDSPAVSHFATCTRANYFRRSA